MKDKMIAYKTKDGAYQSHVYIKLAIPTPMYKKMERVSEYMEIDLHKWIIGRLSGQLSRFHKI